MWTLSKENKAKIPEWNKRWLEDVILRTKPMTPQEKLDVEKAIRAMYRLANLDGDNVNVAFVRSPLEAKLSAVAEDQKHCTNPKRYTSTNSGLYDVVYDGTYNATCKSTVNAAHDATFNYEPHHETSRATDSKLYGTTYAAAYSASCGIIKNCVCSSLDGFGDGGNLYSYNCCYLSFVRDIIGFECKEYENYKHYETCAKLSGIRFMHEKFCIISDFPVEFHNYTRRNGVVVAHNEKGPSHLWADGFSIWTIDGVKVTKQIVLNPETLTIKQIDSEINEEVKRVMIDRFGWARYISETSAKCLDARINDVDGTSEALMVLKDKSVRLLCACKSTARVYAIRVDNKIKTCQKAQSWMSGNKKINVIGVS